MIRKNRNKTKQGIGQRINSWFRHQFTRKQIGKHSRYLILLFFISLVFIGSNHKSKKKTLIINKLKKEVAEKQYEYLTHKAERSNLSTQSKMIELVSDAGLEPIHEPLYIIKE